MAKLHTTKFNEMINETSGWNSNIIKSLSSFRLKMFFKDYNKRIRPISDEKNLMFPLASTNLPSQSSSNIWTSNQLNSRQFMLIPFPCGMLLFWVHNVHRVARPPEEEEEEGNSAELPTLWVPPSLTPGSGRLRGRRGSNWGGISPPSWANLIWAPPAGGAVRGTLLRYLIKFVTVGPCIPTSSPPPPPSSITPTPTVFPTIEISIWPSRHRTCLDTTERFSPARQGINRDHFTFLTSLTPGIWQYLF